MSSKIFHLNPPKKKECNNMVMIYLIHVSFCWWYSIEPFARRMIQWRYRIRNTVFLIKNVNKLHLDTINIIFVQHSTNYKLLFLNMMIQLDQSHDWHCSTLLFCDSNWKDSKTWTAYNYRIRKWYSKRFDAFGWFLFSFFFSSSFNVVFFKRIAEKIWKKMLFIWTTWFGKHFCLRNLFHFVIMFVHKLKVVVNKKQGLAHLRPAFRW